MEITNTHYSVCHHPGNFGLNRFFVENEKHKAYFRFDRNPPTTRPRGVRLELQAQVLFSGTREVWRGKAPTVCCGCVKEKRVAEEMKSVFISGDLFVEGDLV